MSTETDKPTPPSVEDRLRQEIAQLQKDLKAARAPKDQLDIYLKRNRGTRERLNSLLKDAHCACLGVGKKSAVTVTFAFKPKPSNGSRAFELNIASKATVPTPEFPTRVFYADDDLEKADIEDTRQGSFGFVAESDDELDPNDLPINGGAPAFR